jgi:hypothetical protein
VVVAGVLLFASVVVFAIVCSTVVVGSTVVVNGTVVVGDKVVVADIVVVVGTTHSTMQKKLWLNKMLQSGHALQLRIVELEEFAKS